MKTKQHFLVIFIITLTFNSCNKENNCQNEILPTFSLENKYNCSNTASQMDIQLSNDYVIIRNQSKFDNLVTGSCIPVIDFNSYDLIIGKQGLNNGLVSIDYVLTRDCVTKKLELLVTFNTDLTNVAPNVTYHALIPKLGIEETVNVETLIK
ncbi:MAG: hypothetical protein R3342_13405 [Lutibacter sp.]|uniref:hypothetical protein n=1 Tax=Lutibacter sp. TaxID=1925666 RepID=UPI00299F52CA|nr:hypothetical protein [Lutibacter sp.]MDX1830531.1 hypothetical protein [Lutibacter sp.]